MKSNGISSFEVSLAMEIPSEDLLIGCLKQTIANVIPLKNKKKIETVRKNLKKKFICKGSKEKNKFSKMKRKKEENLYMPYGKCCKVTSFSA